MTMNDDWLRAQRELNAHDVLGCVACRGGETPAPAAVSNRCWLGWPRGNGSTDSPPPTG